jgi:hypothetical protein
LCECVLFIIFIHSVLDISDPNQCWRSGPFFYRLSALVHSKKMSSYRLLEAIFINLFYRLRLPLTFLEVSKGYGSGSLYFFFTGCGFLLKCLAPGSQLPDPILQHVLILFFIHFWFYNWSKFWKVAWFFFIPTSRWNLFYYSGIIII